MPAPPAEPVRAPTGEPIRHENGAQRLTQSFYFQYVRSAVGYEKIFDDCSAPARPTGLVDVSKQEEFFAPRCAGKKMASFFKGWGQERKIGPRNHILRPEGSLFVLGTRQDRVQACRGRRDASFGTFRFSPSRVRVGRFRPRSSRHANSRGCRRRAKPTLTRVQCRYFESAKKTLNYKPV